MSTAPANSVSLVISVWNRKDDLRENLAVTKCACAVTPCEADIRDVEVAGASFSVLNFTLQFIPCETRLELLRRIAQGTADGGALVLSEKICFADAAQQRLMTELHHCFKRANGYSDLEIAQKRTALENMMVPETLETHLGRLRAAGFATASCWFQCFNFVSIIAEK